MLKYTNFKLINPHIKYRDTFDNPQSLICIQKVDYLVHNGPFQINQ